MGVWLVWLILAVVLGVAEILTLTAVLGILSAAALITSIAAAVGIPVPIQLGVFAVASVVGSWGVAQWPYILPESLTVADAVASSGTLAAILVAFGLAVLLVVPGFILLYVLDQRRLLPDEGVEDVGDSTLGASAD